MQDRPRLRLVLLACTAACLLACGRTRERSSTPRFLNQDPAVRYVGIDNCVGCHRDKAASFAHTGMGRSFYPLTEGSTVEDFADRNEIEIPEQGLRYRMTRRDGKFFMRQSVPDEGGGETAVDERELVWVVGSGNHSRSYLTVLDGKLFQAPVCWYPEKRIWDLCPGYEEKNDHFGREITGSCVFCHNARMELLPDERNRYREPIPAGIDCERCHGPGQLHVARWRSGKDEPDDEPDPTIVDPRRLPPDLRIQVCFQCHLGDGKATERVPRQERAATDYRPGQPITDVMVPFFFRDASRRDFGISAQADRLVRSRCYRASGGRIECLTCHDPHVTVYREGRPEGFYREKCLTCHRLADCTAPASERQATRAPTDDCVACHMRKLEPDDHRHVRFTDHWIRKTSEYGDSVAVRAAELVPVLPDAFASLPPADRAYYQGRAYFLKAMDFPEAVRTSMWREGEESFLKAIEEGFASADASFFLGKLLWYEKRWDEAASRFRAAVAKDAGHHDAALALGTTLAQQGKVAEAGAAFRLMLERWPGDAGAMAELGRCEAAAGRTAEALALYDRAAAAEPWNAAFRMNRAVILSSLGRQAEARAACEEAMRFNPADATLWRSCSEVLRAAGPRAAASGVERRAGFLASRRR